MVGGAEPFARLFGANGVLLLVLPVVSNPVNR
jgi:hypothetical protein